MQQLTLSSGAIRSWEKQPHICMRLTVSTDVRFTQQLRRLLRPLLRPVLSGCHSILAAELQPPPLLFLLLLRALSPSTLLLAHTDGDGLVLVAEADDSGRRNAAADTDTTHHHHLGLLTTPAVWVHGVIGVQQIRLHDVMVVM